MQAIPDKFNFKSKIRILSADEGGLSLPPFNGFRSDFRYSEDDISKPIYMIWPFFVDEFDKIITDSRPLTGTLDAYMFILNDSLIEYHKERLRIGSEFFCVVGQWIIAKGIVTEFCW